MARVNLDLHAVGSPLKRWSVYVYNEDAAKRVDDFAKEDLATIYADSDLYTVRGQPLESDANGFCKFYAPQNTKIAIALVSDRNEVRWLRHREVLGDGPDFPDAFTNGGFETGDLTGWSESGAVGVAPDVAAYSGDYGCAIGRELQLPVDPLIGPTYANSYVEQTLSLTVGRRYRLMFATRRDSGADVDLKIFLGGSWLQTDDHDTWQLTTTEFTATAASVLFKAITSAPTNKKTGSWLLDACECKPIPENC